MGYCVATIRGKMGHLVANCLIFHNVYSITRILHELAEGGYDVDAETVAMLSPYITGHVKRFRNYTLDLDRSIPSPDYRMAIRSNNCIG